MVRNAGEITIIRSVKKEVFRRNMLKQSDVLLLMDTSGSMNDETLPSDFQSAWREHMQARRDYSNFLNEVSENKIKDESFRRLEDKYITNINKTWAAVLKIGRGYGASSPYVY